MSEQNLSPAAAAGPQTAPAEALAALVTSCPGVASLSGGILGEVATYLPGRRIRGIRLEGSTVEVHVVALWGTPLPPIADQVRAVCQPFARGRPIDVYVDDLDVPPLLVPRG